jgi:hypothetical protein
MRQECQQEVIHVKLDTYANILHWYLMLLIHSAGLVAKLNAKEVLSMVQKFHALKVVIVQREVIEVSNAQLVNTKIEQVCQINLLVSLAQQISLANIWV